MVPHTHERQVAPNLRGRGAFLLPNLCFLASRPPTAASLTNIGPSDRFCPRRRCPGAHGCWHGRCMLALSAARRSLHFPRLIAPRQEVLAPSLLRVRGRSGPFSNTLQLRPCITGSPPPWGDGRVLSRRSSEQHVCRSGWGEGGSCIATGGGRQACSHCHS